MYVFPYNLDVKKHRSGVKWFFYLSLIFDGRTGKEKNKNRSDRELQILEVNEESDVSFEGRIFLNWNRGTNTVEHTPKIGVKTSFFSIVQSIESIVTFSQFLYRLRNV